MLQQVTPAFKVISATPTLEASPDYSSGDRMGTLMTLSGACAPGRASRLVSLTLVDGSAVGEAVSILFFKSSPTIASLDNAALDMTDANAALCVGHVSIATGDYVATSSNKIACLRDLNLVMESGDGGNLYALIRAGATINIAAAGDYVLTFAFEQGA